MHSTYSFIPIQTLFWLFQLRFAAGTVTPILPSNATTAFQVPDGNHFHSRLFLRGAAMKEKCVKLLELLSQIMFSGLGYSEGTNLIF
jgi:hypothetical protein